MVELLEDLVRGDGGHLTGVERSESLLGLDCPTFIDVRVRLVQARQQRFDDGGPINGGYASAVSKTVFVSAGMSRVLLDKRSLRGPFSS